MPMAEKLASEDLVTPTPVWLTPVCKRTVDDQWHWKSINGIKMNIHTEK